MNYIKLYHDLTGAFVDVDNDVIVGRSHLANKLQLITPIALAPDTDTMQVYFVLTNGQITPKRSMTYIGTETVGSDDWYVYEYAIPSSVLSVITNVNANTLQVQFRQVRTVDSVYTHILATEMDTLQINAAITPTEADDVIYVDEYTDLATAIDGKMAIDWNTYSTVTTLNDTDFIAIANGTVVNGKTTVGTLLEHLDGNITGIENDITQLQDQFTTAILEDGVIAIDQNLKTTDSPTFAGITSTDGLVLDGKNIDWNEEDGTFDIVLNGATLQVGQELHFYGKADGAISNGDVVMFSEQQGSHILFTKATGAGLQEFPQAVMGVATSDIANNEFGHVTWFGKVREIDNNTGETWAVGDILYANVTTGQLSKTVPTAPDKIIQVGAVITIGNLLQQDNITILVRPQFIETALLDETGKVDSDYLEDTIVKGASFAGTTLTLDTVDGGTLTVDLSDLSEDADIIASGTLVEDAGSYYLRFTRTDASTFDVDVTTLIDDTNLITSVAGRTGDIVLTESDITDLQAYLTAETDPIFTAWDKSTGISITESQISDLDKYTQAEVDALIETGSTTLKIQRFVITNADNGDGTFTYDYPQGSLTGLTGAFDGSQYTFTLQETVQYIIGANRLELKVNNTQNFYPSDTEVVELSTTTIGLTYVLQTNDEVHIKVYQGMDTVAIEVGDGTISRVKLDTALVADLDSKLETESDPVFVAHTVYNIANGTGKLTNNGSGTWSYDNTSYTPTSRTIAGIDLVDNITTDEIKTAIGNATTSLDGLMSSTDKDNLDTLVALLATDDADAVVNTIGEVLAIFDQYTEGADLVTALAGKQDTLVSGTNIKTLNSESLLGSGDIDLSKTYAGFDATIKSESGSTYTLDYQTTADQGQIIQLTNATSCTVTVPTNASQAFPIGTQIALVAKGAGTYTVTGDTGVTVNGTSAGSVTIGDQYTSVALLKVATDEWLIVGSLA